MTLTAAILLTMLMAQPPVITACRMDTNIEPVGVFPIQNSMRNGRHLKLKAGKINIEMWTDPETNTIKVIHL